MKRDMEKEKTRGRTRRKQPSQVAGFLYREGRKWCAAALSLCMILNNMASVTWAAESAAEKEVLFKLTSRSLYEALQEAVREETMVDDHFLFAGKEKDVEAYEKLLLLDDDLYELKPEFENKDEVTNAEKKNDLQLRIFASLGWETDPEREYQVVGDEKIIFCLSNASKTEQTAVIQVDEKTTEEIVLVPGSAVVIDSKSEEESLEAESGDERKEDEEQEETESGESEGQAEEENNSEGVKGVGGNSSTGGAAGGNGGNSGNDSNVGNSESDISSSDSNNSGDSSEKEDFAESGSSAEGEDFAESEGTVESETSAKNEGSVGNENSIENEDKADESAVDAEENRNDETQEKADVEEQDKESKDSQETVNKPETGNSQENTKEPESTNTQENTNTQDKAEEKDEKKDEEVRNNPTSEKEGMEKPDKTGVGSNESGKSDKAESGNNESKKTDKDESGNADSGKADKADKPDKSDNKESSKPETSEKSESGNTSTGKGEKSGTGKTENEHSGNSDSSKKSESSKDSSDSGSSDNSSDKGKEVSEGISRNVIRLVADNLEVSTSDDVEETEGAEETTIIDAQEKQKEETIEEESEEIKIETEEAKTEIEEAETEEVTTKTEEVKAETASPSDVEDNEIEGELYAPVVMNEESIIVFVTTAEELGLNRAELRKASDSNAKRISPAYEDEVELENVIVQVRADENVLPEGVKLQVKELKQEGEDAAQYEEAKEALDNQGTEYDGMMALDISFLDKKGREIEPDGNVQVSIKVKKEVLPEETNLESIAVQHLAEDEGEIFVEEVADCGDKTRGKVEVEAEEHVEAAFEVDTFSIFTIIWSQDMGGKKSKDTAVKLHVNFYNEADGQQIEGPIIKDSISREMILSGENKVVDLKSYFENAIEGYSDYVRATFSAKTYKLSDKADEANLMWAQNVIDENGMIRYNMFNESGDVTRIEIDRISESQPPTLKYKITMCNVTESGEKRCDLYGGSGGYDSKNENEIQIGNETMMAALEVTLNVYCRSNETDFGILNNVVRNGCLSASRPLKIGEHYEWYKWNKSLGNNPDDSLKEKVVRTQITGDKWNMNEQESEVNVALDGGSQKYYQVKIVDEQNNVIASAPYLINYYDELQNGGFEDYKIPLTTQRYQYIRNGAVNDSGKPLVWKSTTGTVEIVQERSSLHHLDINNKSDEPMQGAQCAELNSDGSGSLYQDVLTIPGSMLNWSLLHRARGPESVSEGQHDFEDTMYVLIMKTEQAQRITTQAELDELVEDIRNNPEGFPGASITELTDDNWGWGRHGGNYLVGDDQCLTRFFFIAGTVASNDPTLGNLLDDIYFGTDIPPVSASKGALSITKIVSGLSEEDIKNYKIELEITSPKDCDLGELSVFTLNEDGTYSARVPLEIFGLDSDKGTYSKSIDFTELPAGEYSVKEILSEYSQNDKLNVSMTQVDKDGNVIKDDLNTLNQLLCKVSVEQGKRTYVNITNAYPNTPKGNFSVKKIFKDGIENSFESGDITFSGVQFELYVTDEKWTPYSFDSQPISTGKIELLDDELGSQDKVGIINFKSIPEGNYFLHEQKPPTGYKQSSDRRIVIGSPKEMEFGVYLYDEENDSYTCVSNENSYIGVVNEKEEENVPGAILPDTGGPGLAMFERYGWFLLMLALLMAGVEVRCYGERKYRRVSAGQHEEFEDSL